MTAVTTNPRCTARAVVMMRGGLTMASRVLAFVDTGCDGVTSSSSTAAMARGVFQ